MACALSLGSAGPYQRLPVNVFWLTMHPCFNKSGWLLCNLGNKLEDCSCPQHQETTPHQFYKPLYNHLAGKINMTKHKKEQYRFEFGVLSPK